MGYMEKLDTSKFEFPVRMSTIYVPAPDAEMGDYIAVPESAGRAVLREDTGEVLGIHGDQYRLVPYVDQLRPVNNALLDSGLDLSDITVKDSLYEGGARMEREIIFNKHKFAVDPGRGYFPHQPSYYDTGAEVGDTVALVLRMRNSYDGGWSYESSFGGKRLRCLNGVWVLDTIARTRGKHTANLSNTAAIEKIKRGIEMMDTMKDALVDMTKTRVTAGQVQTLFKRTLAYVPRQDKETPPFSDRVLAHLMNIWERNEAELGATKWTAYNAATEWATHVEDTMSKRGSAHNVRYQREAKVASMLKSKEWDSVIDLPAAIAA